MGALCYHCLIALLPFPSIGPVVCVCACVRVDLGL